MQLVLSNNRVITHGENFIPMGGGVVINTETGAKYENATIAECEGCPSDINEVGYEYHAGVFVPCAPFGKGNNNGYFMEVCKDCATPRSSGIPVKGGLKLENLDRSSITALALDGAKITLLWENSSVKSEFAGQTITLASADYDFLIVACNDATGVVPYGNTATLVSGIVLSSGGLEAVTLLQREATANGGRVIFAECRYQKDSNGDAGVIKTQIKPLKIYGVKI